MKLRHVLTFIAAVCIAMAVTACSGANIEDEPKVTSEAEISSQEDTLPEKVTYTRDGDSVTHVFTLEEDEELIKALDALYDAMYESSGGSEDDPNAGKEDLKGGHECFDLSDRRLLYFNQGYTKVNGRYHSKGEFPELWEEVRTQLSKAFSRDGLTY